MSAYLTKLNILRTTELLEVKAESPTVKTFTFSDSLCANAKPGQFLMLWIPGVDEIPLSIMKTNKNEISVTVKEVGDATRHLHQMEKGDLIGVRGPFGNHFLEIRGRILMVGGGTGLAPLLFLAQKLAEKADRVNFVVGAKSKGELLFLKELTGLCGENSVISTTEDGSFGLQCLATEPVESLLEKEKFNMIYTCGPEKMVKKIFEICDKRQLPMEASLERLMRCGIGLCGSCIIGKYRVCRDGPVFTLARLREVKNELGVSKLGFDGSRIEI